MTLRVLIADDESVARKRLRRLLDAMQQVEVVAECIDGNQVVAAIERDSNIDVAILDIRMPGLTGIDARGLMPADGPAVIFATAHAEHAVEAFDVGAADYVLKPIAADRLQKALDRVASVAAAPSQRLAIPTSKGVVLLAPGDVSHALLESELVTVFTAREHFLTDFTLGELALRLGSMTFRRVHRRALLNLDHVAVLDPTPGGGYTARMRGGALVPVSRQTARALRRELGLR